MALGNRNNNVKFMHIKDGKFRIPNGQKDEQEKTLYDEGDQFDGLLTGLRFADKEFDGKPYREATLTFQDGGMIYRLGMNAGYGYVQGILRTLPNVDIHKRLCMSVKMEMVEQKKIVSVFLSQDDKPLKRYWTKDNPGNMPPVREFEGKNGQTEYDNRKQVQFVEDWLTENFIPKLSGQEPGQQADTSFDFGGSGEEPEHDGKLF